MKIESARKSASTVEKLPDGDGPIYLFITCFKFCKST
jgi:hypothetical protein